jgi:hypothetical protein
MLPANKNASLDQAKGFQRMFAPGGLTLGVFFPIETFQAAGSVASLVAAKGSGL